MKRQLSNLVRAGILSLVLVAPAVVAQKAAAPDAQQQAQKGAAPDAQQQAMVRIAEEVRRRIVTEPNYGVFDAIHFAIKGNTVILRGYASRPILKTNLEKAVKRIEGVATVDNQIQVLPLSNMDDRIRAAVYAVIYRDPVLQRYTSNRGRPVPPNTVARAAGGITNDPPIGYHAIHIIVNNGNVTLTGVVDSESDLAVAGIRANSVPGVFSVDNDLQIANKS